MLLSIFQKTFSQNRQGRITATLAGVASLMACASAPAAITNVSVSGVTNTQAIFSYSSPNNQACKVEVSESPTYVPLVHDVDPSIFAGANLDSRPGSIADGITRKFIAGKRTAEIGSDGVRYSRALQSTTPYYFRITCGSDVATGQFTTQAIAFGNTFQDPPPVNETGGGYAWPDLSATDRTQIIIDPQTGAMIKRLTLDGDRVITINSESGMMVFGSGWTNASAAISKAGSSTAATISGDNQSMLRVAPSPGTYFSGIILTDVASLASLNYYQLSLTAWTSNAGCNSTVTDDCKVVVCLTIDGVTCRTGGNQYEQALKTTPQTYTFGSKNVLDLWQAAGSPPVNAMDAGTRNGSVNCDGSANVTLAGGSAFNTNWGSGSAISINGQTYTIAAITNDRALQLTTTCPSTNGSAVNYTGYNFGALVRKKTTSTDIVSIQAATVSYQLGIYPYQDFSGDFDICAATTIIGPTGNPGYNCAGENSGPMWWIDAKTGEAHMWGRYNNSGCGNFDTIPFDTVDPSSWYCGGNTITKFKYYGTYLEPQNTSEPGSYQDYESLPQCTGSLPNPTNQPCVVMTTLTGSTNMGQLLTAFDSTFDAGRFAGWALTGVESGLIELRVYRGPAPQSGAIGWVVAFDPNAMSNGQPNNAGCVGAGQPGCIVAAMPSWSRPNARWCVLKAISPVNTAGWMQVTPLYWGGDSDTNPGQGPFIVTVQSSGGLSSQSGVPGGITACPQNQWNATQCTTITVSGEPYDPSPCTASTAVCGTLETGLPGEIGNAMPGDYFTVGTTQEIMRLIQKNGASWTFQRGFVGSPVTAPAGTELYVTCNTITEPSRWGYAQREWFWNYAQDPHGLNATGTTILSDRYGINGHYFWQNITMATPFTLDSRCVNPPMGPGCYQTRSGTDLLSALGVQPTGVVEINPGFNGKSNLSYNTQSHPWGAGLSSPPLDRQFFWDGRPFIGEQLNGTAQNPATLITGTLWKISPSQLSALNRKFLPTFAAAGPHPLLDISSPAQGNTIGGGPSNWYQYCVVVAAGECQAGSQPGEVYANVPYLNYPYCDFVGQASELGDDIDLCVGNNVFSYNSITQTGLRWTDMTGKYERMYTRGLMHGRLESVFWHGHSLANARWMLLYTSWASNIRSEWFLVKLNPPAAMDSVTRNAFIPVQIKLSPPSGIKVDNAIVEFGYSEYGPAANYYCTTRAESCAVGPASNPAKIDSTNPYFFETAEAGSLTGTPCASGCTISIPGISQRVVYGRVVYRDASKNRLAQSVPFAIATP